MAYKAGNLEIELLGIDTNAVKSIQDTAKALNILSNAFKRIEQTQIVFVGQKLEHIFTKLASATKSIDTTSLTALASAGKSLSAISRIGNLEKVDFTKVGKGFENLSVAITPFLEKVKSAEVSLTALYGTLSKASGKKIQGLLGGDTATPKGKKGGAFSFLNIAKWGAVIYSARRFGRVIGNIVQSGADYTETLNLWETAMGGNLNVATEFVNKMNEAYGISEKTLMNAQAIFKNMLGSLGQISDTMAYSLSEGITQMALDYASLYNQTFEQAFTKFQAALAGQVRPIRSVAGYDITENTLYQLYQSLGGTKTMRQLTRTEKQLLSILAIFNQMTASGAVGDLDKTMESFANQSRVMAESWQQVKTYAGALLTYTLQESGILTYVNAVLMFIGDTLKAVVESMGAIEHFGGNIFESTTESALGASDAIDEVQGKLLDFDKFRALSGAEENALGLDEKLLQALSGYDTILGNASMKARELADNLKIASGLFNEDGTFNIERWEEIVDTIEAFGHALLSIIASKAIIGIVNGIKNFTLASKGLSNILLTGVIFAILQAIDAFRDGDVVTGIIATTIGVVLVGALVAFKIAQHKANIATQLLTQGIQTQNAFMITYGATIGKTSIALKSLGVAMASAVASFTLFDSIISGLDGTARQTVSIISIIVGALATLLGVILAIKGGLKGGLIGATIEGLGVGALLAGIKGVATQNSNIEYNAMGASNIDSGTLFVAGEMGRTEAVFNGTNGKTNVANIQQMQMAFNGALSNWWSSAKHDIPQFKEVSKTGIYEVAKSEMRRRGEW